ncbi:putative ataxin-2 [Helianthus annuus]|nr:putative ataxin-2 [Helianthus annuus]
MGVVENGNHAGSVDQQQHQSSDQQKNMLYGNGNHEEEGFRKEMRDLADMLSKLNPMAAEFVPPITLQ